MKAVDLRGHVRKFIDPALELHSTESTKQAKPQGGAAFHCPAFIPALHSDDGTPVTSPAISRFLSGGRMTVASSRSRSDWKSLKMPSNFYYFNASVLTRLPPARRAENFKLRGLSEWLFSTLGIDAT